MNKSKRFIIVIIVIVIFCLFLGGISILYLTKDNNKNEKITIGKNGNWYVNDVDTDVSAYNIGTNTTRILTGNTIPNIGNINDIFVDIDSFDYYLYIDDYWQLRGNIKDKPKEVSYEGDLELHLLEDGTYAVYSCKNTEVEEIIIPSHHNKRPITKLMKESLFNCKSLTHIEIPNTINEIEEDALNCIELVCNEYKDCFYIGNQENPYLVIVVYDTPTIHILDETKFIYNLCDLVLFGPKEFILSDNNKWFKLFDGNLYNKDMTKLISYTNDSGIPDSVTSLGDWSFSSYTNLTSIEIPDSVTSIGDSAFAYCDLIKITIPDSVTSIGYCTFMFCTSLTDVVISNSVTSIGSAALSDCTSLTSIEIPNSVISIGDGAFSFCESLTSIEIPDSVTSIGNRAFEYCRKLEQINVSSSNPNYMSIDGNLYTKDGKILVQYAIGKHENEFYIPDGVMIIKDCAFEECRNLTKITISDSVTNIGNYVFRFCSNLEQINVSPNNLHYISIDGNLYTRYRETLVQYAIGKQEDEFNIPDGVMIIKDCAFESCKLSKITIPDSVTTIGGWAFSGCYDLNSIVIPKNVTSIGECAFQNNATIYCELVSQPSGWASNWYPYRSMNKVYWANQWEYDPDGNPIRIK